MEFETKSRKSDIIKKVKCKFTPMEFETKSRKSDIIKKVKCKFTPMEFETSSLVMVKFFCSGVNLLRWSLKLLTLSY